MANKNPKTPGTAAFPVLHPLSVPTAQRGSATQQKRKLASDRANTRRVLRGNAETAAKVIEERFGTGSMPTAKQLAARKAKSGPTNPPTVAEFTAKKYEAK